MENLYKFLSIILLLSLVFGSAYIFSDTVFEQNPIKQIEELGNTPNVSDIDFDDSGAGDKRIVSNQFSTIEPNKVTYTIVGNVDSYQVSGYKKDIEDRYKISPYAGYFAFLKRRESIIQTDPEKEYLVLLFSKSYPDTVNITDWKIFSHKNRRAKNIPEGVKLLDPGRRTRESDINVIPGDVIIISSGRSPVGDSFQVNKCSGFRSQFKSFSPNIKARCPSSRDIFVDFDEVPFDDDVCFQEVRDLDRCQVVENIPRGISRECRDLFEDEITEEGCVKRYKDDLDFYIPEWRVYLNSSRELWEDEGSDAIYLLDSQDRLVASIIYD